MRDLVRHHAGQLGFIVGREDQATVHIEKAAWQRESVDFIIVEDLDGERHAGVGVPYQVLPDAIDVLVDDGISDQSRLLLDFM